MCCRCQPHYIRHVFLEISGEAFDMHAQIHSASAELFFCYLLSFLLFYLFLLFIIGLSKCTGAPSFIGCNYPPSPPLPAPHSAQIQKNSFHYRCLTKGHIRQCGMASLSIDAFSGLTHPLAVLCVLFRPAHPLPFLLPSSPPTLGIIFLCP